MAWPIDRPIPALMTDADLMEFMDLKKSAFYVRKARGVFRRLEVKGLKLGTRGSDTRYSGKLCAQLRDGNPLSHFGHRDARQVARTQTSAGSH